MRKILFVLFAAAITLGLGGCHHGKEELSASKAKSMVKKEMKRLGTDEGTVGLRIGYFECNDNDTRYAYRQLAAAGVVSYKCDIVKKPTRVKKYRYVSYGYGYSYREPYYADTLVDAYFITVALTDKGANFVADTNKKIEPCKDIAELGLDRVYDDSKLPEASVPFDEFGNNAVAEPEEEPVAEVEEAEMTLGNGEESYEEPSNEPAGLSKEYEKAKAKEKIEYVAVVACKLKVYKIRNIAVDASEAPMATAEAIIEYSSVTPFGRILSKIHDGERFVMHDVKFAYYNDKGWQLYRSDSELAEELERYQDQLEKERENK